MSQKFETALPIFVIGDSHTLPYKNLLFRDKWTSQWMTVRSKYISGLTSQGFYVPQTGEFYPPIIDCLEYEGLIRDGEATHLSKHEIDFSIAKASGLPVTPPLVLFTSGDIDIRGTLMPMFGDRYDFVPPFDLPYPLLDRPIITWDIVLETIEKHLSPFLAGLSQLKAAGFNRLYVQSVVPPTTNEARVKELHGFGCPLSVRSKLTASFNRILAEKTKTIGVAMIDIWPQVTRNGYLLPDFEVDGVHLPPSAAMMHLEQLLDHAINCSWESVNFVRHEMFYRLACGLPAINSQMDTAQ